MTTDTKGQPKAAPRGRAEPRPEAAMPMAEAPTHEPREAMPARHVTPGQVYTDWASI